MGEKASLAEGEIVTLCFTMEGDGALMTHRADPDEDILDMVRPPGATGGHQHFVDQVHRLEDRGQHRAPRNTILRDGDFPH